MMMFDEQITATDRNGLIVRADGETTASGQTRSETYIMMSGGPVSDQELSMRFVVRNNPNNKTAPGLIIAAVLHSNGLFVGIQKVDGTDGYATRRIIEGLSAAITTSLGFEDETPGIQVDVTLPQRKAERESALVWFDGDPDNAWSEERLRIMSDKVTLRLADSEEAAPLPVPSVDPLAPIYQSMQMPDMSDMLDLLGPLEKRLRTDPNARTFSVRDDIALRDQMHYVFDADLWTSPRTAVVGAAGSGKSSLISALIDMSGHDLPPSGLSRTTLCPIVFHNDSKIKNFRFEVECHSVSHVKEAVRSRLEEAARAALSSGTVSISDRAARILARSDDSTFDMRLIFGRLKHGNTVWSDILDMFNAALEDIRQEADPQAACDSSVMVDIISEDITYRIFAALKSLGFGRMQMRADGTPDRFGYASTSRIGMVEAGRRFFSASMRHAGKSFAPLCKRITFRGHFVPTRDFMLVDNRGFDHEGDLAQAAAADIMREVEAADRVMVIEDAAKVGSRATMELIAQIVAAGSGQKVFFVQSKADTVLDKGIDIEQHVRSGLSNGLAALRSRVGDMAIATLEENVARGAVYQFGNLDRFEIPKGGLVNAAADDELGIDNAHEARRMFFLMASDPQQGPIIDISVLQPQYDASLVGQFVRNAIGRAAAGIASRYGLDGDNAGHESHWGTIKAENRRVAKMLEANDPEAVESEIAAMSWFESVAIVEGMSLMLDRPMAWHSLLDDADRKTVAMAEESVKAELRRHMSSTIHHIVAQIMLWSPRQVWRDAYALTQVTFGAGSTFERGRMLRTISDHMPVVASQIAEKITHDLTASGALCFHPETKPDFSASENHVPPEGTRDERLAEFCEKNWILEDAEEDEIERFAVVADAEEETTDETEGDFDHA
jgi:hypothetical protein